MNEGGEKRGNKRHASFLIDLLLLESYPLDCDRILAQTANLLEFIFELHQTRLVGCELCGGTDGVDVEWDDNEPRENRDSDN